MRKILFMTLLLAGCATPVTKAQWQACEAVCADQGGVKEACDELVRGPGCHCESDRIVWLDELKASE